MAGAALEPFLAFLQVSGLFLEFLQLGYAQVVELDVGIGQGVGYPGVQSDDRSGERPGFRVWDFHH